jgi:hypothetical protein
VADAIPLKKWPGGVGEMEPGDQVPAGFLPVPELATAFGLLVCTAGGTANAQTLTPVFTAAAPAAYVDGAEYATKFVTTNTGAATINISGLGAKAAVTITGVALPAGYLRTDVRTRLWYDGSIDKLVVDRQPETFVNASGRGLRLANGYQRTIQTYSASVAITTATGALFVGTGPTTAYPAAFASTPDVLTRAYAAGTTAVISAGRPSTVSATQAGFQPISTASTTTAVTFTVEAVGDWY